MSAFSKTMAKGHKGQGKKNEWGYYGDLPHFLVLSYFYPLRVYTEWTGSVLTSDLCPYRVLHRFVSQFGGRTCSLTMWWKVHAHSHRRVRYSYKASTSNLHFSSHMRSNAEKHHLTYCRIMSSVFYITQCSSRLYASENNYLINWVIGLLSAMFLFSWRFKYKYKAAHWT